jgi:two-component system, NtrC family, sensor kinase
MVYANTAFHALADLASGQSAQQPKGAADVGFHLGGEHPLARALREGHRSTDVFAADVVLCGESGARTVLRVRSEPIRDAAAAATHRLALVRNVTRELALEEAARRNERLACIGLLAAGIAHEINNPAGSVLLAAETALAVMDAPNSGPQVAACLRNIVTSIDRCGRIVRTLLRYSREEPSEKQACSISDVAKQALELARPYAERYGAELHLELDPEPPLAPMNPLEIELVLINLVRNAIEAGVGKGSHVTVLIRTQRTAEGVRVAVCDNGCGMSGEQVAHMFDPLYTTRREVGGSGLGMSIAQGIVKEHKGRMDVESHPGQGTVVTIDLPAASSSVAGDPTT